MRHQCYQCGNAEAEKYYSVAETSQAASGAAVSRYFCSMQCYVQRKYELFICQRSGIDLRSGYVAQKGRISNIVPKSMTWLRWYKKYEKGAKIVLFFQHIQHNPRAYVNAMKFFGDESCEDVGTGHSKFAIWKNKIPPIQSIPLTYTQYETKRRYEIAMARAAREESKKTRKPTNQDGEISAEVGVREEDTMAVPLSFVNAMEQEGEADDDPDGIVEYYAVADLVNRVYEKQDWNDVSDVS
jgi:hypothetical protein